MMGGIGNDSETDDDDLATDGEMEETVVIDTDDDDIDNVGDISVEVNVEELVAKIESGDSGDSERRKAIKKRLEELSEEIGDNLDGTYNINLDDD